MEAELGFPVVKSFEALGAEWPVNPGAGLKHERELDRFDECAL